MSPCIICYKSDQFLLKLANEEFLKIFLEGLQFHFDKNGRDMTTFPFCFNCFNNLRVMMEIKEKIKHLETEYSKVEKHIHLTAWMSFNNLKKVICPSGNSSIPKAHSSKLSETQTQTQDEFFELRETIYSALKGQFLSENGEDDRTKINKGSTINNGLEITEFPSAPDGPIVETPNEEDASTTSFSFNSTVSSTPSYLIQKPLEHQTVRSSTQKSKKETSKKGIKLNNNIGEGTIELSYDLDTPSIDVEKAIMKRIVKIKVQNLKSKQNVVANVGNGQFPRIKPNQTRRNSNKGGKKKRAKSSYFIWYCVGCNFKFDDRDEQKKHFIAEHYSIETKLFECAQCDKSFPNLKSLNSHSKYIHKK